MLKVVTVLVLYTVVVVVLVLNVVLAQVAKYVLVGLDVILLALKVVVYVVVVS